MPGYNLTSSLRPPLLLSMPLFDWKWLERASRVEEMEVEVVMDIDSEAQVGEMAALVLTLDDHVAPSSSTIADAEM